MKKPPTKSLSQLSLKSKRSSDSHATLVRQNRDQHDRITELQAQRDDALRASHDMATQRDKLAGQVVGLRMTTARLERELTQTRSRLADHEQQLTAATKIYWDDSTTIADLRERNRLLKERLEFLRKGLEAIAASGGSVLVRGELEALMATLKAELEG